MNICFSQYMLGSSAFPKNYHHSEHLADIDVFFIQRNCCIVYSGYAWSVVFGIFSSNQFRGFSI